jgi:hypothetical protein
MEKKETILQELREISPLIAGIQSINPYSAPPGYFTAFPDIMLEKLGIETTLAAADAPTYRVPTGYFEGLSANILDRIRNQAAGTGVREELAEIAPLLNTISRQDMYQVPAGYFEQTDFAGIAQKKKEGKVFTLRIARKWTQYAAAAVMAGILVTGAFVFTGDKSNISETENERTGVSSELKQVSEADLAKYLDNPEHFVAAPAATALAPEEELADVRTNIKNLSDEELNQYLKENVEVFDPVVSEK